MKAIETHYKGYRFRSRLEARWAVFFDALGIKWEYEPEGYEFPDGTKYLPDFYLPESDIFCEVKPTSFSEEEKRKLFLLRHFTKKPTVELDGIPDFRAYNICKPLINITEANSFSVCFLGVYDRKVDVLYKTDFEQNLDIARLFLQDEWIDRFKEAINMAKSARFEFGDTPEIKPIIIKYSWLVYEISFKYNCYIGYTNNPYEEIKDHLDQQIEETKLADTGYNLKDFKPHICFKAETEEEAEMKWQWRIFTYILETPCPEMSLLNKKPINIKKYYGLFAEKSKLGTEEQKYFDNDWIIK